MPPRRFIHPQERFAREFRRAAWERDREPADRLERAGFAYPGYRGRYAERPGYLWPPDARPGPSGSGWPSPVRELSEESENRRLRALRDRDLARAVDVALYHSIGRAADRVSVYAADAVITLEGALSDPSSARAALDTAWHVPGVRRVRNALRVMQPQRPRPSRPRIAPPRGPGHLRRHRDIH